tara:strand:+ start:3867 stop:4730 length:864 start_codon:yes stop_codon:yes gene_type:complete
MKKYIFCIPSSTDFAVATAVLIYSIKRNLKIAEDCDFVVPYNNLSEKAMNYIRQAHSDVKFEKPKDSSFYSEIPKTIYGVDNYDVYLSFEAFWQNGYEKCIYLDADMLCINDFSEIILDNKGEVSWKYPNLGTVVIGDNYLGESTYRKLIEVALSMHKHKPGGDQDSVNTLFGAGAPNDVTYFDEMYNFQDWGGGGTGSNRNFQEKKDKVKIVHYSGRRKPWGKVWDSDIYDTEDKNCIYYPHMMWNCEAVRIWHQYFEEFKIYAFGANSPIERHQKTNNVIVEDTP